MNRKGILGVSFIFLIIVTNEENNTLVITLTTNKLKAEMAYSYNHNEYRRMS